MLFLTACGPTDADLQKVKDDAAAAIAVLEAEITDLETAVEEATTDKEVLTEQLAEANAALAAATNTIRFGKIVATGDIKSIKIIDGEQGWAGDNDEFVVTVPKPGDVLQAQAILKDNKTASDGAPTTYLWYQGTNEANVLGTSNKFTVTTDLVGKIISVKVTNTSLSDAALATKNAEAALLANLLALDPNMKAYYAAADTSLSFANWVKSLMTSDFTLDELSKPNSSDFKMDLTERGKAVITIDEGFDWELLKNQVPGPGTPSGDPLAVYAGVSFAHFNTDDRVTDDHATLPDGLPIPGWTNANNTAKANKDDQDIGWRWWIKVGERPEAGAIPEAVADYTNHAYFFYWNTNSELVKIYDLTVTVKAA
jgi:hypothetical protein